MSYRRWAIPENQSYEFAFLTELISETINSLLMKLCTSVGSSCVLLYVQLHKLRVYILRDPLRQKRELVQTQFQSKWPYKVAVLTEWISETIDSSLMKLRTSVGSSCMLLYVQFQKLEDYSSRDPLRQKRELIQTHFQSKWSMRQFGQKGESPF